LLFSAVVYANDNRDEPVLTGGVSAAGVNADASVGGGNGGKGGQQTNNGKKQTNTGTGVRPAAYIPQAPTRLNPACTALGDAWYYDQADGGPSCGGGPSQARVSPGSRVSQQLSLADFARGEENDVPWPTIDVDMNPRLATVAVPTYYWILHYAGQDVVAHAKVTRQEGENCHDEGGPTADDPDATPTQICEPNMVTYQITVTAHPGTYRWNFGDGSNPLVLHGPDGLGQPFVPPAYTSTVNHNFETSSFQQESAGGFPVTVQITWNASWVADGGPDYQASGTLPDVTETFTMHQHVREIQVLRD
jgi:hypothetical protein